MGIIDVCIDGNHVFKVGYGAHVSLLGLPVNVLELVNLFWARREVHHVLIEQVLRVAHLLHILHLLVVA